MPDSRKKRLLPPQNTLERSRRHEDQPRKPCGQIAAFFDLDRTIVRANTGSFYILDLYADGQLSLLSLMKLGWVFLRYRLTGVENIDAFTKAGAALSGVRSSDIKTRYARLLESKIRPLISDAAVEAIRGHWRLGHVVVMLTAQSSFIAEPIGHLLGIDHVLCTRFEEVDGVLTGRLVGPACYGRGKVHWAHEFAAEHGIDVRSSYFYTDSHSDLPMLYEVKEKRAVNPDPKLRREATRRGWPVLRFED